MFRILQNHAEVESFFNESGFLVIDPARFTNVQLFAIAENACNLVITNGSALATALIFFSRSTRVFILNSAGYQPDWRVKLQTKAETPANVESLGDFEKDIWRNALARFNHTYIEAVQNVIAKEELEKVINDLRVCNPAACSGKESGTQTVQL